MLPVPLPSRGNLLFPGVQGLLGYKETQAACLRAAASSPVPQTSAALRTLSHTYQGSSKPRSYFSLSLSLKGDRDTSELRGWSSAQQPGGTAPSCGCARQRLHAPIRRGPGSAPGWQKPSGDDAPNPGEAQGVAVPRQLGTIASWWCWPMPSCAQRARHRGQRSFLRLVRLQTALVAIKPHRE